MAARVLIISLRQMGMAPIGYGSMFEFEDAIQRVEDAQRVELVSNQDSLRVKIPHRVNTAVRLMTGGRFGNTGPLPWPADVRLDQDYDMAFFIADAVFHMRLVNLVREVRKRCRKMVLFVQESWPEDYEDRRIHTQPYQLFDHYFFDVNASDGRFAEYSQRPTHDLAVACDTLRFASGRRWHERMYDVTWVGRRDPAQHARLVSLCERRGWRYYYDPYATAWSQDPLNQRRWLGALMGDSRFSINNYARSNQPEVHRGKRHVASRFAESLAAGNALVGNLPEARYREGFMPWPESAFESDSRPDEVIEQLAAEPQRMERVSRRNMAHALRRHDWAHRWAQVLDTVGLPPTQRLQDYLAQLDRRAMDFDDEPALKPATAVSATPAHAVPAGVAPLPMPLPTLLPGVAQPLREPQAGAAHA